MSLYLEPAWKHSFSELTELLNQGYTGYLVPIHFTPPELAKGVRILGIDLSTSQVVYENGVAVGIALLAHRGWTTRLAAMGIVPDYRHKGTGRWVLEKMLAAGRQRGDRQWALEVITENHAAVRLYEKLGFTVLRRLLGYLCPGPQGEPSAALEEVDVSTVARVLLQVQAPDLPWQISGETLAQRGPPARGYRLGEALAVVEPQETQVELLSLVVPPAARRQGAATRLLRALFASYPGLTWKIPARIPEEIPPALLEKLGFALDPFSQQHMVLNLV